MGVVQHAKLAHKKLEIQVPIYSYLCDQCGNRFELKQGFDSKPKQPCPNCQKLARREFHSVGVIYKGTGFYTTDYARPQANRPGNTPGTSEASPSEGSESSSTDSKQAPEPSGTDSS